DQVRARDQYEDRQGARPHHPAVAAAAGGSGAGVKRRAFVTGLGAVLAAPRAAEAQQPRVYHIGVVHPGGTYSEVVEGLREGLKDVGFEDGKQVVFDVRDTKGDLKTIEVAAKSLEAAKVDLIVSVASSTTVAVKRATAQVRIVFYAGADPVKLGLVESFRQPG